MPIPYVGPEPSSISDLAYKGYVDSAVGPKMWAAAASAMTKWQLALSDRAANVAKMFMISDSYGSDFTSSWDGMTQTLINKYGSGFGSSGGWKPISTGLGNWTTRQGTPSTTVGLNARAQIMSAGQYCQNVFFGDGILFVWWANASSTATGLLLKVDGVTVATVDGRTAGTYYYAFPNGYGTKTIRYESNTGATNTVDGVFVYQGNRTAGLQIWDISRTGYKNGDWVAQAELSTFLANEQPHGVFIQTGTNDVSDTQYRTDLNSLLSIINTQVTVDPSVALYCNFWTRPNNVYGPLKTVQAKSFCATNNVCLIDMSRVIGQIDGTATNPDSQNITSDGTHPTPKTKLIISQMSVIPWEIESLYGPATDERVVLTPDTAYSARGDECVILTSSDSPVTITIQQPYNSILTGSQMALGHNLKIIQGGLGVVTVVAGTGSITGPIVSTSGKNSTLDLFASTLFIWTARADQPTNYGYLAANYR